jgi:hypothetical protein
MANTAANLPRRRPGSPIANRMATARIRIRIRPEQ